MSKLRVRLLLLIATSLVCLWAVVSIGNGAHVIDAERVFQVAPAEDEFQVFMPQALRSAPVNPLYLSRAWTVSAQALPANHFSSSETIFYLAEGISAADVPLGASLAWSLQGPCDSGTLYTETRSLDPGAWAVAYSQIAPACSGVYTYTFKTQTLSRTYAASANFTVDNPVDVVVWNRQAFDKCDLPSLAQMSVWWPHSPYWAVNLYIGGVHRGCANLNLTPQWVASTLAQGWGLIPTWVGPQAPCSRYTHRISYDLSEAYVQGRSEADAASLAAVSLGLTASGTGGGIIYYDLEGYSWRDAPGCRAAVQSFISGWVERLHELGIQAGVYGGACSSYVSDWASITHPPDYVWIAAWYTDGYDPGAGVFTMPCVSTGLWANHQRIRQYAGDVGETWGGLRMSIDCNITDGAVLAMTEPALEARPEPGESMIEVRAPQVSSFGLVGGGQAWALLDGDLYWLGTQGLDWATRRSAPASAQQAFFLDASQGWLLTGGGPFVLARTADGGQTWQSAWLGGDELAGALPLSLSFADAQNGWAVFRLPSSANFSTPALYRTQDGGTTWLALPEPPSTTLTFTDAQNGWALGGPTPDRLYRTQDGGISWTEQPVWAASALGQVFYTLPVFSDAQNGVFARTVREAETARLEIYASTDGGATWFLQGRLHLAVSVGMDGPLAVALLGGRHAWVADPGGGLHITVDGGRVWQFSHNLPLGVMEMAFRSPQQGWARISAGDCAWGGACAQTTSLWQTQDGGLTWRMTSP